METIGTALVEDKILTTLFCCDLAVCRGACCTLEGGRGAPVEDHEVREIERAYPAIRPSLRAESLAVIEARGLVEGGTGNFSTPCIDNRECVYVVFVDGIARCAFETAYEDGRTAWPKPLSCHLFPIRVQSAREDVLHYESIHECAGGRARGEAEKVPLPLFLRPALTRKYGEQWMNQLLERCR
jgi:hypothetical protein